MSVEIRLMTRAACGVKRLIFKPLSRKMVPTSVLLNRFLMSLLVCDRSSIFC